jgi:hypothetical protein
MDDEDRTDFLQEIQAWDFASLKAKAEDREKFTQEQNTLIKAEIVRREHAAESEKVRYQQQMEFWERLKNAEGNVVRLLILGNAGGTIATLSFIGTMVGKSPNLMFDEATFWVLVVFILGLAGGWAYRVAERDTAQAHFDRVLKRDFDQIEESTISAESWGRMKHYSVMFSFICLISGVLTGLVRLFKMTL